ncbi:hypothetical protein B0H21DRAFT_179741 [Amylocystis lapponica]|nr:hypothetical protein B0H21DRAFT_179741 [Amylocystis lapponica]
MKRTAEKQLSKDDDDDDVEEVSPPDQGFKMADETVLARRPMRALPRRSIAAVTPPTSAPSTPEPSPAPVPKFTGFSGFGASSGDAAPFSFSAPSASSSPLRPATTSTSDSAFSFNVPSTNSFALPPASSTSAPSVASSASRATRAFASFINPPAAVGPTSEAPPTGSSDVDDDTLKAEIKYLKALRGLNVSFLSAISKAIESDPFVDVADVLDRYKSLRISAKSEYDDKLHISTTSSRSETRTPGTVPVGKAPTTASSASAPSIAPASSMPAPPASFSWSKPSSDSAENSSSTSDSTKGSENAPTPPPAFTFGRPAATSGNMLSSTAPPPPKSAFTFGSNSGSTAPTFGSSSSTSSSAPLFGSTQSSFTFGNAASPPSPTKAGESKPSPFGFNAPSAFTFGKAADKPSETGSAKDKDNGSKDKGSSVGPATSTSLFGGTSTFTTPEKPAGSSSNSFTFGSGSPGKASVFGGFSKAGGSIGNPVGFGFGSPPRTPDEASTPKPAGFSFGAPPKPTTTETGGESSEGTEGEGEAPPLVSKPSVHDLEGEGEEDEETTHETRSKVYKMVKDQEKSEWGDMGIGMLRLKRHKETGARRILLRNSSTGKIIINFNIHPGMNTVVAGKTVSFMGHDAGAPMPFRIKVKSEDQADALKHALDREIEFVKAKTET